MDEFAPVCKFTYMQNNLHMCNFGHENGALDYLYQSIYHMYVQIHYTVIL